jgi:hypothetical protein
MKFSHQAENCIFSLRSMAISNRILEISQDLDRRRAKRRSCGSVSQLVAEQIDLTRMRHDLLTKIRDILIYFTF